MTPMKMLRGGSFDFTEQIPCAFSAMEAIRVARIRYPVITAPVRSYDIRVVPNRQGVLLQAFRTNRAFDFLIRNSKRGFSAVICLDNTKAA